MLFAFIEYSATTCLFQYLINNALPSESQDSREVLSEEVSSLKKDLEEEKTKQTEILENNNIQLHELKELKEKNLKLGQELTHRTEESYEYVLFCCRVFGSLSVEVVKVFIVGAQIEATP